jgi:hypothetical protein
MTRAGRAEIDFQPKSWRAVVDFHLLVRRTIGTMQYMMLIYMDEKALSETDREQCYRESTAYAHRLHASGHYRGASPLYPTETATSIRHTDGKPVITDGPFAETREQLGGFFLVEARDLDEAISIASGIPAGKWGTVEVRPVIDVPGLPVVVTPASHELELATQKGK